MKNLSCFTFLILFSFSYISSLQAGKIYDWDFTTSDTDSVSGVVADLGNPSARDAMGYTFRGGMLGDGIRITQPMGTAVTGNYTIEMVFSLESVVPGDYEYQKLIDFENAEEDEGLYVYDDYLHFYYYASTEQERDNIVQGQELTIVISRDASTKKIYATVNGVKAWSVRDSLNDAVFSSPGNVMQFFEDDSSADETGGGTVKSIRVFNRALSDPADIAKQAKKCRKLKKALRKAKKSKSRGRIARAKRKLKKCTKQLRMLRARRSLSAL